MKRTKEESQDPEEVVAYLLEIVGTREDAERAAEMWGVRIRILNERTEKNGQPVVMAVCPAEDARDIFEWHESAMGRLREGDARPGDLRRVEQPPPETHTDFSTVPKRQRARLIVTNPRKIVFDEL